MTTPGTVVPDASVLLKWVLRTTDEDHLRQALSLRTEIVEERVEAVLPSLWLFEIANTLGRKLPAEAEALVGSLVDLAIPEREPDPLWLKTGLALVTTYGVAFYDASYHATAILADGVFVTDDRRYVNRVRDHDHIVLLEDWRAEADAPPV